MHEAHVIGQVAINIGIQRLHSDIQRHNTHSSAKSVSRWNVGNDIRRLEGPWKDIQERNDINNAYRLNAALSEHSVSILLSI